MIPSRWLVFIPIRIIKKESRQYRGLHEWRPGARSAGQVCKIQAPHVRVGFCMALEAGSVVGPCIHAVGVVLVGRDDMPDCAVLPGSAFVVVPQAIVKRTLNAITFIDTSK